MQAGPSAGQMYVDIVGRQHRHVLSASSGGGVPLTLVNLGDAECFRWFPTSMQR